MMNEIILNSEDNATVIGNLAHCIRFHMWDSLVEEIPEIEKGKFYVLEVNADKLIVKAIQSSFSGAKSYMNPDRVMIYRI